MSGRDESRDRAEDPGPHSAAAGAPGASGPGEPALDPNGTPPNLVEAAGDALHRRVAEDED